MKTSKSLNVVKTNAWYCEKQTQHIKRKKKSREEGVNKTRGKRKKTNKLGLGSHCFVQCKSVK